MPKTIPTPVGICPLCANETHWGNCETCARTYAAWLETQQGEAEDDDA